MSRGINRVKIMDHRFHGAYAILLVRKFNALVNQEPLPEEPADARCITLNDIRHLSSVEELRDALHIYAYNGQKLANTDHEENKKLYDIVFKVGVLAGVGAVFGAFANLSPQLLAMGGVLSLWALFGILYSESLRDDAIKEFKRLADNVNDVYLRWKEKPKPTEA